MSDATVLTVENIIEPVEMPRGEPSVSDIVYYQSATNNSLESIDVGSFFDLVLEAIAQRAFDAAHPIGEQYVQFPSMPDMDDVQRNTVEPMTLYNVNGITSTWVELNFDGAFFRANGGLSENFGSQSVPQGAQLPNIKGTLNMKTYSTANAPTGAFTQTWSDPNVTPSGTNKDVNRNVSFSAHDSNPVYTDGGEVRPPNYTVKIWQRTA